MQSSNSQLCKFSGCGKTVRAIGLCAGHETQMRKHGEMRPLMPWTAPGTSLQEKLALHSVQDGECVIWTGSLDSGGYGGIGVNGRRKLAHRVSYELNRGPIPIGMFIDHLCFRKACINPDHLQVVTPKQNNENQSGVNRQNTSGFRGVSWHSRSGKWRVDVKHHNRQYSGGTFSNIEDAEAAAIALRMKLFTNNLLDRKKEAS